MRRLISVLLALLAAGATWAADAEREFTRPPMTARPYTWWHWCNGNITKAGLAADLAEMKRVGVGGAEIFNVDPGIPAGPVKFLSPEWRALFKFAVEEANRQGLELCLHNCAGWSSSGGPWVKPDQAMQQVTFNELRLRGPQKLATTLATPPNRLKTYRDIAVIAFPTPPAEQVRMADAAPKLTASEARFDAARVTDGNPDTFTTLSLPRKGAPTWVLLSFAEPYAARALRMPMGPGRNGHHGELQASDDGTTFRTLRTFALPRGWGDSRPVVMINFPLTKARYWRVAFTDGDTKAGRITVGEIELESGHRIDGWMRKALYTPTGGMQPDRTRIEAADLAIARDQIVDLTARLGADGRIEWDVPAGHWTIMRFGFTPTGAQCAPAPAEGRGLECDKLDAAAADAFWASGVAPLLKDIGPLAGKTLTQILIDSYEVGMQNWTGKLPAEFQQRRGYALLTWLPTLSGRVVGDLEQSERFLWDFRRTVAAMFNENYYGRFAELCHQSGLQSGNEPYGNGPFDELSSGGMADVPMCEFWARSGGDLTNSKLASSVAHTYGRQYVGAESFTATDVNGRWQNDPWDLKALGDLMWTGGVNRFIFHCYAHQPWLDKVPGMTMGPWGFHFGRTSTWWNQSPAWHEYLTRSQALLQAGLYVADVAYFAGEDSPVHSPGRGHLRPALPVGYEFDNCDRTILNRFKVQDGKLVLPHGMSYRVLVLPERALVTVELLKQVRELVRAGATVVGPKPHGSPSLSGWPESDREVQALAAELWADCDGQKVTEHRLGAGRIVWGRPLAALLKELQVAPDVSFATDEDRASLPWIHRRIDGTDAYFVCNQQTQVLEADVTFRQPGRQPELWWADSGQMELAPVWQPVADGLRVHLRLEPKGSVWVVFRRPAAAADPVVAIERDGPAPAPVQPDELVIESAVYGVLVHETPGCADITERVKTALRDGAKEIPATNDFAGGDPAPNVVKELRVEFTVNGERRSLTVSENERLRLPEGAVVVRARYGLVTDEEDAPKGQVEVTRQLQALVKDGRLRVRAGNEIAGDPANMVVKQLRVDYRLNGVRRTITVGEGQELRLPPADADGLATPPAWQRRVGADGRAVLTCWSPGVYTVRTAGGRQRQVKPPTDPRQVEVAGPWTVSFPPNWGAPQSIQLPKLISWTEHSEAGVRYFSGTAEYTGDVDLPATCFGPDQVLQLDLGRVKNLAEVVLNGQSLGVLWKQPFRVDITRAAKRGRNRLQVKVTNLWVNRLIGDEQLPDDRRWSPDGRLLAWPQWYLDGQPKPADGRYTWTTWRHWTKDSPLLESGLLGPVRVRVGVEVAD